MKLFFCVLLLGIGAQGQTSAQPRVIVCPNAACFQKALNEFDQAAQKAADETDGKPLSKLNCTMDAFTHKISPPECAAEPIHRICHLRQMIDQGGGMETYVLDCIPEVKFPEAK